MTGFAARSRHALPARVAPAGARARGGSPRAARRGRAHAGRRGCRRLAAARGARPGARGGGAEARRPRRRRGAAARPVPPRRGQASRRRGRPCGRSDRAGRHRRHQPRRAARRRDAGARAEPRRRRRRAEAAAGRVSLSSASVEPSWTRCPASARSRRRRSSTIASRTAASARSTTSTRFPVSDQRVSSSCGSSCRRDRAPLADLARPRRVPRPGVANAVRAPAARARPRRPGRRGRCNALPMRGCRPASWRLHSPAGGSARSGSERSIAACSSPSSAARRR